MIKFSPSTLGYFKTKHWSFLSRHVANLMLGMSMMLFIVASYFAYQAFTAYQFKLSYLNKQIIKQPLDPDHPQQAYAIAYLKSQQISTRADVDYISKALSMAEVTNQPDLRARAKFASGNLYFDLAMQSSKIAEGGAHQQAVAQIELARESYKNALRIDPNMHAAIFNLELLDRLSPEKRTQGWLAETDGVTLQPFKRNGTAMMKDNTRRGLP